MADPFDPPPGDGGAMLTAAKAMGNVHDDLSSDITKVKGGVALAQEDWRAQRQQDFATGMFGIQTQLVLTEDGIGNVATIMNAFGRALNATTTEVAHLKTQADAIRGQITTAQSSPGPDHRPDIPGGPGDTSGLQLQLSALETKATAAKSALTKLAGQLAAAVDAQTNKLVPGGASMDPAAIRRQVLAGLDVTGLGPNGTGLDPTRAWAIMSTATWQGQQVLDLAEDNADGEQAGGPSTYLMTDVGELQQLLDAAREDGILPVHYSALLHQFWVARAAQRAGINLDGWDPQKGVDGNRATISAVYNFYGQLYLNNPRLQWAGLANLVGPTFAGGFMDLDMFKHLASEIGKPINDLPGWVRGALPEPLPALGAVTNLSAAELGWYEHKFMSMQKHIFMDIGAMHEAYTDGGLASITEYYQAGLMDQATYDAWTKVPGGNPQELQAATQQFANREQNTVIANQYNEMYNHDGPIGPAMTYLMTAAGSASIPNTKTPGQYKPLSFSASESISGPFGIWHEKVGATVSTPLPDINIAHKDERWDYITHDTLPAYYKFLAQNNGADARAMISSSIDQRIDEQRLSNRIPQLLEDGLTDWGIDINGDVGVLGVDVGGGVSVGH